MPSFNKQSWCSPCPLSCSLSSTSCILTSTSILNGSCCLDGDHAVARPGQSRPSARLTGGIFGRAFRETLHQLGVFRARVHIPRWRHVASQSRHPFTRGLTPSITARFPSQMLVINTALDNLRHFWISTCRLEVSLELGHAALSTSPELVPWVGNLPRCSLSHLSRSFSSTSSISPTGIKNRAIERLVN